MPPPNDGNEYKPFVDLIKLEKINDVTYRSIALPFSPGGDLPGTYDRVSEWQRTVPIPYRPCILYGAKLISAA